MARPKEGISKEARDHLLSKLDKMDRRERKKTEKRLQMYDMGQRPKKEADWEIG